MGERRASSDNMRKLEAYDLLSDTPYVYCEVVKFTARDICREVYNGLVMFRKANKCNPKKIILSVMAYDLLKEDFEREDVTLFGIAVEKKNLPQDQIALLVL